MTRTYGGITIELPSILWVFDLWESRPVYHAADWRAREGHADHQHVTRCGIACENRGSLGDAKWMPPKHVIRFARPCQRCWPELRTATLELKAAPL